MKQRISGSPVGIFVSVVLLMACAPKTTPVPTAAPAATQAAPLPTAAPAAPVSVEDTAWAKVVEAAQKEGKVNMYTFRFTGDSGVSLARAFKERYGITVNVISGSGSVLSERVSVESRAGQNIVDLAEFAPDFMPRLQREGLLVSMGALPVLRDKDVFVVSPQLEPDLNALRFELLPLGIAINTRQIGPEDEPKAWLDLLKPKYKGKMGFDDPVSGSSPTLTYVYLKNNNILPDVDEFYRGLAKQDIKIIVTKQEVYSSLIRGDIALAFAGIAPAQLVPFIVQGAPVKMIGPEEGVFIATDGLTLVKGAPHPNAAKLLANWLLSPEGQTVYTRAKGMASIRKDVPDSTPPGARMKITKAIPTTIQIYLDLDRLMREQYVAGIFGVKR